MSLKKVQELPRKGKLLCVDVGEKWIGIAISDSNQKLASPRAALIRGKWNEDKNFFSQLIEEEKIIGIIAGNPLTLEGEVGSSADAARCYADLLFELTNLPTALWDERFSTAAAERALFEQRTGRQQRASKKAVKSRTDSASAVLILQNAIDFLSGDTRYV